MTLALALLGACVPAPEEADPDAVPDFEPDTVLGIIQAEGNLVVAVERDSPPVASFEDGEAKGLGVEIGAAVAEALGVEADFVPAASSQQLIEMVEDGDADLAFPITPLTSAALREMSFSNPYYIGHQRLLVRADSGISGIDDLAGQSVCSAIDPVTGVRLDALDPSVDLVERSDVAECSAAITGKRLDAATASDLALMQVAGTSGTLQIVGEELSSEGFAALAGPEASGLADFVDGVLREAVEEGVYTLWYEKWIQPYLGGPAPTEGPGLTAEEAAAFFP